MLTRTDRRRFPVLLAAIAALAMAMLFSPVQAREGSAPDQPTGLDATATHGQVVLTWDDPGDDSITGYVILRRVRVNDTGGDFSVLVADTETAALTYTDDTVAAGLTYTYRIKAINEHGASERSRWVHIDTPAAPAPEEEQAAEPPDQPTGLTAEATHDSVTLTWDDPQDDSITGYVILRRVPGVDPEGQFSELVSDTGTDATTYTDDTVSAETRYTYRIKAINEHGVSERSRWVHIDTPAAPAPEPPANNPATGSPAITGTAQVGETLTVDTSGIGDEDGLENAAFSYQWLADGTAISGATANAYTPVEADEGKAITVQVNFTDDAGNDETLTSAPTDAVAATQPTEPPAEPTGLTAEATHDSVTLTWDDPQDDSITGYVILRRIPGVDPEGQFDELVSDTGTDATTYTDDTVAAETRYTYRIKAINQHGVSERSRWSHINVPAAPEAAEGDEQDEDDGGGAPGGPGKRANVSEGGTDCPATTDTTCEVDVGGKATGEISSGTDQDWFKVELEADTRYQIDLEGKDTGRGTLDDPRLLGISNSAGVAIADTGNLDSGVGENSRVIFEPNASGTFYISAWLQTGEVRRTYTLSVIVLGANGNSEADTDFPATTATTGRVEVGASATGNLRNNSDVDWFRVDLEADKQYQFDQEGAPTGRGTLTDPRLALFSGSGISLALNDDISSANLNSRIVRTATETGAHYLRATRSFGNTGTYTLSVHDITPPPSTDATLSALSVTGGGSELITNFASDTTNYPVSVANGVDEVTFALTTNHSGATVQYLGPGAVTLTDADDMEDGFQVALDVGVNALTLHVLAEDGTTANAYFVNVTRAAACTLNDGDIWCGVVTVGEILSGTNTFAYGFIDVTGLSAGSFGGETGITIGSNDYTFTGLYVPVGGSFEGHVILRANDNFTGTEQEALELHLVVDDTASTWPMSEFEDSTNGQMIAQETDFDWSSATTVTARLRPVTLPTLSVADAEGDEDDGVEFTATLTTAVSAKVTATWTASIESGDTASAADLAATKTGEVEFDADATEAKFTVPLTDDTTDEPDQTFTVTLSGVSTNAQLAADPTAEGTIDDDDDPPTLTVADKRQDEDDIITNVTVSLSEVSEKRVRFRLRGLDRSGDTASLGVDWLQSPTSPFNSMSAGTMSVSRIALQVLNDTLDEDDETLTVEAYSLENAQGSSSDREATITIVDDDPTPTVTVADAAATEGGKVEFVVTLSAVSGRDVEVGYATSVATGQTATSDTDFTAATGTLTILASDSTDTGTVEVQTAEDDASESAETFTLTLSATKNVALGTPSTATGTINDAATDDCPNDTTTTCAVDVGGSATGTIETEDDLDWFKVELEAGTRYQIDMEGLPTSRGTMSDPNLVVRSAAFAVLATDDDGGVGANSRVIYTPTAAGTHYLEARAVNDDTGAYTVSVIVLGANGASEADTDFPVTTSTTGRVEVGASATGNIETGTDRDWFKVVLEAGKFYRIDLEGEVGGGTLEDPYLRNIRDSSGTEISGTENDDIHGGNSDSRVVFRPTAAGAYYLVASGYGGANDTGTYTLSLTELETRTEEGDTDFDASVATLGRVEVDGSATGEIKTIADADWFRVVLEAGKTYVFDLEGTATSAGTLPDPYLTLLNASGGKLSEDDDGGDGANSRLEYTATASGIHYLEAWIGSFTESDKGTYTLSVREVACTLNEGDHWCGVVTVGPILSGTNTIGHGYAEVTGINGGSFKGDTDITVGSNDYTFEGIFVTSTGGNIGALNFKTTAHFTDDDKAALELHIDVDGAGSTWAISDSTTTTGVGLILWTTAALDWSEATTVTARLRPLTLPTVSVADAEGDEDDGVEFTATLTTAWSSRRR